MNILFATVAPIKQGPAGLSSEYASARYRVLIPTQQLMRLGHQVQLASLPGAGLPRQLLEASCDVLVISKSFHAETEELAKVMKARGARVVVDLCDDHFERPVEGAHQRALIGLADQVVASTEAMAKSIRVHTGRESRIVTDPVEGPRGEPRFEPRFPELRVVWFGHPSNLDGLGEKGDELVRLSQQAAVHLTIVTEPLAALAAFVTQVNQANPGRLRAETIPWSVADTWRALKDSDLAWIPVSSLSTKAMKSPNRLLESLWAGRLVIADPVPSYMPYADLVPVGVPLEEAVAQALRDPQKVRANIAAAQRRIARDHSAFACGRAWAEALGDTAIPALKVNLGCGDKILPGYVNVDVVESRAGMRPDVICDLHDLAPFGDNSVDEILSVHVVEHFWRWEVRDILREWMRVLKPGGRMILECPNLLSACGTFLENPEQFSREDQNGQRTMWVFYGDPAWKDPLMIHRWGYTPASLGQLLTEVGLADVRQEPAQFKLREPRDMRIVGTKP